LAAMLLYNAHTMGSPLKMPFSLTGSQNVPGFGVRGIHELTTFDFGIVDGLSSTAQNLGWFVRWQFGGILLIPLVVFGIWCRRETNPMRWAVVGLVATYLVGYTAFWSPWAIIYSWPGAQTLGPFYILPVLLPVALLAGAGLDALAARRRSLAVGAVVLLVVATLLGLPDKIDPNRATTDIYRRTTAAVDEARLSNAIVVDPERGDFGFVSSAPSFENRPTFDGPVVWADEVGGGVFDLLAAYPGRAPYRLDHVLPRGKPLAQRSPLLLPQRSYQAGSLDLRLHVTSPVDEARLTSFVHVGPVDRFIDVADAASAGDSFEVTWHLSPSAIGAEATVTLGAAAPNGLIAIGIEVVTDRTERYEWRVPYRVAADGVEVLLPGAPWHLWAGTKPAIWLQEDVRPVLTVSSVAAVRAPTAPG
jgi:hypothetical protein